MGSGRSLKYGEVVCVFSFRLCLLCLAQRMLCFGVGVRALESAAVDSKGQEVFHVDSAADPTPPGHWTFGLGSGCARSEKALFTSCPLDCLAVAGLMLPKSPRTLTENGP